MMHANDTTYEIESKLALAHADELNQKIRHFFEVEHADLDAHQVVGTLGIHAMNVLAGLMYGTAKAGSDPAQILKHLVDGAAAMFVERVANEVKQYN